MSRIAKIDEGGTQRTFTQVGKLSTNLQGGGVCYWVPEDERELGSKSINQNGSYVAEQDGLYGYDEVTVNIPNAGGVTGKDPVTGEDVTVTVDPETGELEETIVPYAIQIEQLPTQLIYTEGQTIDYTGIIVGAYDSRGNRLQEVPFAELIFTETTAHSSGSGGGYTPKDSLPILELYYNYPITAVQSLSWEGELTDWYGDTYTVHNEITISDGFLVASQYGNNYYVNAISQNANAIIQTDRWATGEGSRASQYTVHQETKVSDQIYTTYGGKTFHVQTAFVNVPYPDGIWQQNKNAISRTDALWTQLGTALLDDPSTSGEETCPVQWMRPGDYKILDDYFEITVQSVESGTAHGGENSGGGFEGGGSEHGF